MINPYFLVTDKQGKNHTYEYLDKKLTCDIIKDICYIPNLDYTLLHPLYRFIENERPRNRIFICSNSCCPVETGLYNLVAEKLKEYEAEIGVYKHNLVKQLSELSTEYRNNNGSIEFDLYEKPRLVKEYQDLRKKYTTLYQIGDTENDIKPVSAQEYYDKYCKQ